MKCVDTKMTVGWIPKSLGGIDQIARLLSRFVLSEPARSASNINLNSIC